MVALGIGARTPFPVSAEALADDRLASGATVVVATIDGETRAWPVEPPRTIDDRIGTTELTVTVDGTGGTVVDGSGNAIPNRTSLWFAIVAAFPDVTVGHRRVVSRNGAHAFLARHRPGHDRRPSPPLGVRDRRRRGR